MAAASEFALDSRRNKTRAAVAIIVSMGVIDTLRRWMTGRSAEPASTLALGAMGERAAEQHLRARGVKIIARNYRCPAGELDLIGVDGDTIVFFEVKSRKSDAHADPEDNITPKKQRKLYNVARYWLKANAEPDAAYRFDALSVVIHDGKPVVRHIEEAFIPRLR